MIIENYDKNFIEETFLSYASNVFVKLLTGIMLNEINDIKHFMTEELSLKIEEKIKENNLKNQIQMYDELNVRSIKIINKELKENNIYIEVELDSRYMDYILDKKNNKIIKGTNSHRIEKKYNLVFRKKLSAKSNEFINKCEGCGSTIDPNNTGICSYCGKIFKQEDHEYILEKIDL